MEVEAVRSRSWDRRDLDRLSIVGVPPIAHEVVIDEGRSPRRDLGRKPFALDAAFLGFARERVLRGLGLADADGLWRLRSTVQDLGDVDPRENAGERNEHPAGNRFHVLFLRQCARSRLAIVSRRAPARPSLGFLAGVVSEEGADRRRQDGMGGTYTREGTKARTPAAGRESRGRRGHRRSKTVGTDRPGLATAIRPFCRAGSGG
jgi:hypothetical protein